MHSAGTTSSPGRHPSIDPQEPPGNGVNPWADRLWRWRRDTAVAAALAIAMVAAATGLRLALDPLTGDAVPFITYFPAIMIATLLGGLRAGLLATALSCLLAWYLFVPPPHVWAKSERKLILLFAASALLSAAAASLFNLMSERVLTQHRAVLAGRQRESERQQLMIRELEHRTRNLFGLVKTIARTSLRDGADVTAVRELFLRRLDAFAVAYSPESMPRDGRLSALLDRILKVYRDRFDITGCDLVLSEPALQQFALVVHELQTNAIKYGALSNATGRIAIEGHLEGRGALAQFRFLWLENGGPRVVPPGRTGFGHTILYRSPTYDGARVTMEHRPEGFRYRYSIELSRIAATMPA